MSSSALLYSQRFGDTPFGIFQGLHAKLGRPHYDTMWVVRQVDDFFVLAQNQTKV